VHAQVIGVICARDWLPLHGAAFELQIGNSQTQSCNCKIRILQTHLAQNLTNALPQCHPELYLL